MSSAEKIKRLFAKSDLTVNSKIDDRIINDALAAFDKSEKTQSVSPEPNIWRIIMKSRITKLAAAAVVIIAVMVGMHWIGSSIDGTSILYAKVREAIQVSRLIPQSHSIQTILTLVLKKDEKLGLKQRQRGENTRKSNRTPHSSLLFTKPNLI